MDPESPEILDPERVRNMNEREGGEHERKGKYRVAAVF
jgi:hypothetical protein